MVKRFCIVFILLQATCLFCAEKVAFVIGTQDYKNAPLNNPVNDASAMKNALSGMGFDVIYGEDCTADDFDKKLGEFYKKSSKADISFFYYSGHGIQSDNENYLLPINADVSNEAKLSRSAVKFSDVQNKVHSSGCGKVVFILDACRNNPFKKTRGNDRGLRPVSVSDIVQSMVVFSCAPGETADDGDGMHSPFTESLLKYISKNDTLTDIIMAVTNDVKQKTNGKQSPWKQDNVSTHIYLNKHGNEIRTIDNSYSYNKNPPILLVVFASSAASILLLLLVLYRSHLAKNVELATVKVQRNIKSVQEKYTIARNAIKESSKSETKEDNNINSMLDAVLIKNLFYVTCTPVTVGQFSFIGEYDTQDDSNEVCEIPLNENFPKINVSYLDAIKWCNRLSEKEGLLPCYDLSNEDEIKIDVTKSGWRLPSVNEWKKCAKASSFQKYNSLQECKKSETNKLGLYDMYGLVWQWCNDCVKGKYVIKGGAWDSDVKYCSKKTFLAVDKNLKSDAIGFRCVRNK